MKREVRDKLSPQLEKELERTRGNATIEVIVRVRDPRKDQTGGANGSGTESPSPDAERNYSLALLRDVAGYVAGLGQQGQRASVLNTSWLTQSLLLRATPKVLRELAARPDVEFMDLNAAVGKSEPCLASPC